MSMIEPDDTIPEVDVVMGWSGVVLPLGVQSGELDRRTFRNPSWPPLPITLADDHYGTELLGPIDAMEVVTRDDAVSRLGLTPEESALLGDENLWASGRFAPTEEGEKSAGQLAFWGRLPVSIEGRDGTLIETIEEDPDIEVDPSIDEDFPPVVQVTQVWDPITVGSVAIERVPAFAGAWIRPDAEAAAYVASEAPVVPLEDAPADDDVAAELAATVDAMRVLADPAVVRAAGAGPAPYPVAHFARPEDGFAYAAQTRLTIAADGEVTGHVLPAGKASRTTLGDDWVAARNPGDDLSEYLVGAVALDDGRLVAAGVIVSDGLHGPAHLAGASGDDMRQLIESTATQVAQVTAWWDEHGLAVHGSTSPGVTAAQATRAMAGCPSVDERRFDGRGWMTTGVLCVNTCRFSPGEAMVRVASGVEVSRLVASASPQGCGCGGGAVVSGGCTCASPAPAVREPGRLARLDQGMDRERLRAAVAAVRR